MNYDESGNVRLACSGQLGPIDYDLYYSESDTFCFPFSPDFYDVDEARVRIDFQFGESLLIDLARP